MPAHVPFHEDLFLIICLSIEKKESKKKIKKISTQHTHKKKMFTTQTNCSLKCLTRTFCITCNWQQFAPACQLMRRCWGPMIGQQRSTNTILVLCVRTWSVSHQKFITKTKRWNQKKSLLHRRCWCWTNYFNGRCFSDHLGFFASISITTQQYDWTTVTNHTKHFSFALSDRSKFR